MSDIILDLQNISKDYQKTANELTGGKELVHALTDISFQLTAGEHLGILGETGSGKSTLGRIISNIEPPSSGQILFAGEAFTRRTYRHIQAIFQDPDSALNPRRTVNQSLEEGVRALTDFTPAVIEQEKLRLLDFFSISSQELTKYPHQLSGGQKQRIAIIRSLLIQPDILVCDEILSALDVITAQEILTFLASYIKQFHTTIIFITHDIHTIRDITKRSIVLLQGRIVEDNKTSVLLKHPQHRYTQALIDAIPKIQI